VLQIGAYNGKGSKWLRTATDKINRFESVTSLFSLTVHEEFYKMLVLVFLSCATSTNHAPLF